MRLGIMPAKPQPPSALKSDDVTGFREPRLLARFRWHSPIERVVQQQYAPHVSSIKMPSDSRFGFVHAAGGSAATRIPHSRMTFPPIAVAGAGPDLCARLQTMRGASGSTRNDAFGALLRTGASEKGSKGSDRSHSPIHLAAPAPVQVFGRRDDERRLALRRPASKKRQGTKSREVWRRLGSERYGDLTFAPAMMVGAKLAPGDLDGCGGGTWKRAMGSLGGRVDRINGRSAR